MSKNELAVGGVVEGKLGDWIKELLSDVDLSGMTEQQFVDAVLKLYDANVAPLLLSVSPPWGMILNKVARSIVEKKAREFYKNHSNPA